MAALRMTFAILVVLALAAAAASAQNALNTGSALAGGGAKSAVVPQSVEEETFVLSPGAQSEGNGGSVLPGFPTGAPLAEQIDAIRKMRSSAVRRANGIGALVQAMDAESGARARAERDRAADVPPSPATQLFQELGRMPTDVTPYEVTHAAVRQHRPSVESEPREQLTGTDLRRAQLQSEARALFEKHATRPGPAQGG